MSNEANLPCPYCSQNVYFDCDDDTQLVHCSSCEGHFVVKIDWRPVITSVLVLQTLSQAGLPPLKVEEPL